MQIKFARCGYLFAAGQILLEKNFRAKYKTSMSQPDDSDFVHIGPGTTAGRYLMRFWQPVYRSEDLAKGQAVPVRIMSENYTLYRGESGKPYIVAFRCAHRGAQL